MNLAEKKVLSGVFQLSKTTGKDGFPQVIASFRESDSVLNFILNGVTYFLKVRKPQNSSQTVSSSQWDVPVTTWRYGSEVRLSYSERPEETPSPR